MCQAFEAEKAMMIGIEKKDLREKYEAYERGEIELSDDELLSMAARMLMLREG